MQWRYNVIKVHSSIDDLCLLTSSFKIVLMFCKTNMAGNTFCNSKKASMTRKYQNHTLQANPRHIEEEPQNTNSQKTPGRQLM